MRLHEVSGFRGQHALPSERQVLKKHKSMKVVLKNDTVKEVRGADIKEITVSVFDDAIIIVLHNGEVLMAKSLQAK